MADAAASNYTNIQQPALQLQVQPPDPAMSQIPLSVPKGNPMDVTGGSSPSIGPSTVSNPLSLLSSFADTQQKLNQVKLFNQTLAARQRAGQIMATAPDTATGLAEMQKDPQVSAFVPEIAQTVASTQNSILQNQGTVQTQATDAYHLLMSGLPAVLQDKTAWPALANSVLAITSPAARPAMQQALKDWQSFLTDPELDSKGNPVPVTLDKQNQRLSGVIIANGQGDSVNRILAQPGTETVGGAVVPVTTTPAQGGVHGEAPGTIAEVPGRQASPGSGGGPAPAGGLVDSAVGPLKVGSSPSLGSGLLGQQSLSPAQQAAATARAADWNGSELHAFQNAQMTSGLLDQMGADFDAMVKAGGWQVPGAAANLRQSFTGALNTFYQGLGQKPPFDATAQAAEENLTKNTRTMGLTVLTTMLGNQREAAQTIHDITQAVPSINNSYLGGKILIDTLGAANQRNIDRRNFENAWQARNQGNLQGADEAFNEQAPMTQYTDAVLAKYGLGPSGFETLPALENAARLGYISPKQAADIAREKNFALPKGQ